MKLPIALAAFLLSAFPVFAQPCVNAAKQVKPELLEPAAQTYRANLAVAREAYNRNPTIAEEMIWYGRRTAYLGEYKDAIRIFTEGIRKFPNDARFYRHRGHRYITLRCFKDAIEDLEIGISRPVHCNRIFGITSVWPTTSKAILNVRFEPIAKRRRFRRTRTCWSRQSTGSI